MEKNLFENLRIFISYPPPYIQLAVIMTNQNAFLEKLRKIVYEHYTDEQFGVSDLVEGFGMSRSQLHRKLKRATGQSISQFIREIRLEEALKLLQEEDITASEASYQVGFNSPTYFNTRFNEYFGYPPGETQHELELAKSTSPNVRNPVDIGSDKNSFSRNRRVLIWLVAITLIVSALFIYNYFSLFKEAVVTVTEKEKTIAVLPLKNWSGNSELEYISDGMTDAIISKLSEIQDFDRVMPFASMIRYKDTHMDLKEIAKELNVAYVLEGNFKLSGTKVQSNLKLIEASKLEHVWNLEYTGEWKSNEIFEMQATVAENVAKNMKATISENELADIQKIPTNNKKAYNLFLQAEFQKNKQTEDAFKNAIPLYKQAIALDSTFARAHSGLADIWSMGGLVWGIYDEQEAWGNAKRLLLKTLDIDSTTIHIYSQLYRGYFYYDWDFDLVEKFYQNRFHRPESDRSMAIDLDYLTKIGRHNEAFLEVERRILNDPSYAVYYSFKAEILMFLGRGNEAIDLLESTDPLYSDNWWYLRETAKLYYYLGEYGKSKRQLKKSMTNFPNDYPPILMWLNAAHAQLDGNSTEATKYLAELHGEYNESSSGSPAWFIALYYCALKDYENAFKWLQKSYERHEVEMTWLKEEPLLQSLKGDPRYIDLYNKMGFQYVDQKFLK